MWQKNLAITNFGFGSFSFAEYRVAVAHSCIAGLRHVLWHAGHLSSKPYMPHGKEEPLPSDYVDVLPAPCPEIGGV